MCCKCRNKSLFGSDSVFKIKNFLLNETETIGYCVLESPNKILGMNFNKSVLPYNSGLIGAPYPTLFEYLIFDMNTDSTDKSLNSLTGEFFFKQNAGTLPDYSGLLIPYGTYSTYGRLDKDCKGCNLTFSLKDQEDMTLIVK
jgi:hypothetical protein